jgi:chloride channel 3/4/5
MANDEEANENTPLISPGIAELRGGNIPGSSEISSIISSSLSKEEEALGKTAIGERLPYNDYTTIDWLHDLVSCIDVHPSEKELMAW